MCDRCELDMMMYGEIPVPLKKPAQKPKFAAEQVEEKAESAERPDQPENEKTGDAGRELGEPWISG